MSPISTLLLAVALRSAISAGPSPAPIPRRMALEEALQHVTAQHPQLQAARQDVAASGAAARVLRGRLLPRIALGDTQALSRTRPHIGAQLLPGLDASRLAGVPGDVVANVFTVSAAQPLLGLLHGTQDWAAAQRSHDAQRASLCAQVGDARTRVRTQYLRLFEARALAQTARASQASLDEQVEDARHEAAAGSATQTDVLRMQAAAAGAHQQVIQASAEAHRLHADLLEMLGLGDAGEAIDFEPPELPELHPQDAGALMPLRLTALQRRPELRAQAQLAQAAGLRSRARALALLPELSVQGLYGHVWARPLGVPESRGSAQIDAFSLMLSASWPVWEWGAAHFAARQAEHEARAARARLEAARRQVGAEVALRHAEYTANTSAIGVAQAQVASAEEAFRVMQVARSAGSATTTDLLAAEAARTQARMDLTRARYESVIAQAEMQRAIGEAL